jgi:hypothetical protein
MAEQRAEFDSPWKEIIEAYFKDFLAFFFPEIHADVDWSKGYEFLDTELQQIVRDAELGKRFADKLVKVWRCNGEERLVLIHIEVQNSRETVLPERIFVYNYRLRDRYNRPVVSLAILTDDHPSWRPQEFQAGLWGCDVHFRFPMVKLLDYRQQWQSLEDSLNPFATVVMAHLKALETKDNQVQRKDWKFNLTRRLYEKGYERQDILNLFRFVDWIIALPKDLETSFRQELEQYEQEKQMPYVTSIERMAKQEGVREGLLSGIEVALEIKFGNEGLKLLPEITQIEDIEVLRTTFKSLKQVQTPDELLLIYQSNIPQQKS